MAAARQPLVIEVTRGPIVESQHQVMAVVTNEMGSMTNWWGNPNFLTAPRSAIKMLQALPLVESGAAEKYELDDKHIALACSSHHGEKDHLAALAQWMEKIHSSESTFTCGPHLPFNEAAAHEMIRRGQKPTALCNNCSGKHLGIISTCLHLGESPAGYDKYEHSAQKRLRKVLSEVMKVDHAKMPFGVDGCGIPTYGVPLQNIATGMAALVNSKESPTRKAAAEKILRAVKNYPHFVSGSDDFTTVVIEKTQGRAIVKVGAEGVYTGVLPEKKIAFAVKAADGGRRAAEIATAAILLQFGGLSEAEYKALSKYTMPTITNWKNEPVGQVRMGK